MPELTDLSYVRALCEKYDFALSKGFGQNFIINPGLPIKIVDASRVDKRYGVIEIGPGIGVLTKELAKRAAKVVSIEVDERLPPLLAETMAGNENLEIIFGDILKTDIKTLVQAEFQSLRPMACANLPYYITTPVLAALLESRAFEAVTVMVQKEVAQRICSPAGKGDYGAFSVFCQYYAEPELLFDVPASCFIPQPKVTSAVLKLTMRKEPVCEIKSETMFFKVVRAAFAQRRKTLLNALSSGLSQFDKPALAAVIEDCGFAPTVRGETLDIPGFAAIANALTEL